MSIRPAHFGLEPVDLPTPVEDIIDSIINDQIALKTSSDNTIVVFSISVGLVREHVKNKIGEKYTCYATGVLIARHYEKLGWTCVVEIHDLISKIVFYARRT